MMLEDNSGNVLGTTPGTGVTPGLGTSMSITELPDITIDKIPNININSIPEINTNIYNSIDDNNEIVPISINGNLDISSIPNINILNKVNNNGNLEPLLVNINSPINYKTFVINLAKELFLCNAFENTEKTTEQCVNEAINRAIVFYDISVDKGLIDDTRKYQCNICNEQIIGKNNYIKHKNSHNK